MDFNELSFVPIRREVIGDQVWWIDRLHLDEILVKSEVAELADWLVFPRTAVYFEVVPLEECDDVFDLRVLEGPVSEENRKLHYQMYLDQLEEEIRSDNEKQEKNVNRDTESL